MTRLSTLVDSLPGAARRECATAEPARHHSADNQQFFGRRRERRSARQPSAFLSFLRAHGSGHLYPHLGRGQCARGSFRRRGLVPSEARGFSKISQPAWSTFHLHWRVMRAAGSFFALSVSARRPRKLFTAPAGRVCPFLHAGTVGAAFFLQTGRRRRSGSRAPLEQREEYLLFGPREFRPDQSAGNYSTMEEPSP